MLSDLLIALEETLFMIFSAGLLTWCIGLPLGILLKAKTQSPIYRCLYYSITLILNSLNTIPSLILLIIMIPVSQKLLGLDKNSMAAVIPMTIAAVPFFAKSTEAALCSIPKGVVDLAISIGATRWQILYKILIPEALPNILQALTDTFVRLIGYAIIAGAVGCGGLGELAIEKGYHQGAYEIDYLSAVVITCILLIQLIQRTGQMIAFGTPVLKRG